MDDEFTSLREKTCAPCSGKERPLKGNSLRPYLDSLPHEWHVVAERLLVKTFRFGDFRTALAFTNAVGALADAEGHHPVIELTWGRVTIRLWTHKIHGLSDNDFILASKIDAIKQPQSSPAFASAALS